MKISFEMQLKLYKGLYFYSYPVLLKRVCQKILDIPGNKLYFDIEKFTFSNTETHCFSCVNSEDLSDVNPKSIKNTKSIFLSFQRLSENVAIYLEIKNGKMELTLETKNPDFESTEKYIKEINIFLHSVFDKYSVDQKVNLSFFQEPSKSDYDKYLNALGIIKTFEKSTLSCGLDEENFLTIKTNKNSRLDYFLVEIYGENIDWFFETFEKIKNF